MTIPLFHCTGSHSAFMLSLIVGRKMVIMHKWDAEEALRLIEEERITWFNGVPTMSAELQAAAETTTGISPPWLKLWPAARRGPRTRWAKSPVPSRSPAPGIGYGLTETNALGAVNAGAFYVANPTAPAGWCPR